MNVKTFQDTRAVIFKKSYLSHPQLSKLWTAQWVLAEPSMWQDKRVAIAKTVDDLGDQFRPAMRAGRLSYIRQAYPDDAAPAAGPPVGQGTLVLPG